MIGIARFIILSLQHLNARPVIRLEAEIIRFVMAGFIGQPVGIVLVAGKAGPPPLTDGEQFADQQATEIIGLMLTQNMLDLTVGFGVVRAILHLSLIHISKPTRLGMI